MGLDLVKREVKTFQYAPYYCQGRIYFAPAQHHKIVRIADDARLQFPAQLMPAPYPVKYIQVAQSHVLDGYSQDTYHAQLFTDNILKYRNKTTFCIGRSSHIANGHLYKT